MKLDIDLSFPFEEKFYFYFLNRASVLYISNLLTNSFFSFDLFYSLKKEKKQGHLCINSNLVFLFSNNKNCISVHDLFFNKKKINDKKQDFIIIENIYDVFSFYNRNKNIIDYFFFKSQGYTDLIIEIENQETEITLNCFLYRFLFFLKKKLPIHSGGFTQTSIQNYIIKLITFVKIFYGKKFFFRQSSCSNKKCCWR